MRQLALDLPALARDPAITHVEASCQRAACAALLGWRGWPGGMLALVGPEGAGKSHLAALWMGMSGARPLRPSGCLEDARGPLLVEDADRGALAERQLLALIDAARGGQAGPVLFTARSTPRRWPVRLPDLGSRLSLMPAVEIDDPSDADLGAVFAKHLGDRGADAPPSLVDYVVRRMERSFATAQRLAAALDRSALERKQRITRSLAHDVLGLGDGRNDQEKRDER
jgi:chromosomal replication initiation ATPase DnaA